MDRRQALRNLGWGAGALVATPTIISILQSCESKPVFTPVFISTAQGHALRSMVDLIIPNDEAIPGAVAVGVHEFIDRYWKEVVPAQASSIDDGFNKPNKTSEQQFIKDAWTTLESKFTETFNKPLEKGTPEEFDQLLAKYLKISKEDNLLKEKAMAEYFVALKDDASIQLEPELQMHYLLTSMRGMTIWGWKTSEEIGKNVLWYDPVPGQYKGCIPLSEAGNGKAMSL